MDSINQEIADYYKSGFSIKQIATKFCRSEKYIRKILTATGIYTPLAQREPIIFNCRQCGNRVVTTPETGDHRTVFCCSHCERKYWRIASKKKR